METKFNFNSSPCTNREQSERLLALGLKKETADMCWINGNILYCEPPELTHDIPAWSLHRLMLLATSNRKVMLMRYDFDIFDYLIRRIEYAIQEGYFNKEYLNEDI